MYRLTKELISTIRSAIHETDSMCAASARLGMQYKTFRRLAREAGVWAPNQPGKGISKKRPSISLDEILAGHHPQYQTYKLKVRLFKEGLKARICEECGIGDRWQGKTLELELDHINGDSADHRWENLRVVCPNCHSQTSTYRAKNMRP